MSDVLLLHTLMELTPDAILVVDVNNTLVEVNSRACQLLGYGRDDLLGKAMAQLVSANDLPRLTTRGWAQGHTAPERWTFLHQSGSPVGVTVSVKSLSDDRWVAILHADDDRQPRLANELFLSELTMRLRHHTDAEAMVWEAVSSLGDYLQGDRCLWHSVDDEQQVAIITRNWRREGASDIAGTYALANLTTPAQMVRLAAGQPLVVTDVAQHPDTAPYAHNYRALEIGALVAIPCIQAGHWVGALTLTTHTPRCWHEQEVLLLQEVVARLWGMIEQARSLQALQNSELRFRTLADNIPQLVWIADANGWIFWYNQRWFDYTGKTLEEMQGWGWQHVHHPDHLERVVQRFRRSIELGDVWEDTFPLRKWDGQYGWFLSRAIPICDEQGTVLQWFGTNTDITERKQTEAALQQSEDRYRMAITSARLGTWDWDLMTNELRWDEQCKAMFGVSPEADVCIEQFYQALHPADRDRLSKIVQQSLNPASGGSYDTEYRTVGLEDGVERWVAAKGQAYFAADGQAVRFIGTVLEITDAKQREAERQRAEALLRDQQERLQAALLAAGTGTFRWDIRTNALDWDNNVDRLFGLGSQQTVSSLDALIQLIHPGDRPEVIHRCTQCATVGATFDVDCRVLHPDASIHWLSGKGKTFLDEMGKPAYVTGAFVDITPLQQQTEELKRINRLKDDFFSALSHELRTPLNPILGWTKLLQGQSLTPEQVNQALEAIERNVKHQIALVNDLLDVSSVLQGKMQLNFQPVELSLLLTNVVQTVQFAAQAKLIRLHFTAPEPIYTMGDSDRLRQVFWNLLSNAIKFTPEGGRVGVELVCVLDNLASVAGELEGGNPALSTSYAQIRIVDNGIGLDPDFLPHVFDHFRQAEGGSTRRYGGLGLGLAIVRHLIELHGGTVTAASEGLGQGATFTVKLPLFGNSTPSQLMPSPPNSLNSLAGLQILVVDDEPDNLELIRFLLSEEGAVVTTALSPEAALQWLHQSSPDLLISDIGMPGMDGYELIQQVRALPSQQSRLTPAIALTAFAQASDQKRAIAAGYQAYLAKPVDPAHIIETILQITGATPSPPG